MAGSGSLLPAFSTPFRKRFNQPLGGRTLVHCSLTHYGDTPLPRNERILAITSNGSHDMRQKFD